MLEAVPLIEDYWGRPMEMTASHADNIEHQSYIQSNKKTELIQQLSDDTNTIMLERKHGKTLSNDLCQEWCLRVTAKDGTSSNVLLYVVILMGGITRQFHAYFYYDMKTKELSLFTLRHDFSQYTPTLYVWRNFEFLFKNKYCAGHLGENYHESMQFIHRQGFGFYLLYERNEVGGKSLNSILKFDTEQSRIQLMGLQDVLGILFPFIPCDYLLSLEKSKKIIIRNLSSPNGNKRKVNPAWIKSITIGGKPLEGIKEKLSPFFEQDTSYIHGFYELRETAAIYRLVLSELEKQMITEAHLEQPSEEEIAQFILKAKADVSASPELSKEVDIVLSRRLSKEDIHHYYKINEFFKRKYEEFKMECAKTSVENKLPIEDFYKEHRSWAFVKLEPPFRKYYILNDLDNNFRPFLASEILRLRQIGLQDFVEGKIPVKVEFQVENKPKVSNQPPGIPKLLTEVEARKMLDGGAESVFTEEELKELLAEPDPSKFKSSAELGMAYDWCGKFAEAKVELEKDGTPLGRFELGRFLMAGRPGIPADRDRANSILEKLVNEMEEREDELTAAECLLAGRACHEIRPRKSTQWAHWTELGDEFLRQAVDLGEKAGHYYIQHYRRMKPEKKLDEIWKALPTDDIEARAGLAGYAGHMQQFRKHRDQERHLQDLKTAVQARCNRAQYWLGLLYSMGVGEPGKYLKHNNEKARFWLKRAAERGDWEAQFLLSTLPKQ